MELTNEFKVGLPVDDAWHVLTDVERIAPCMPGAQLQEIEGDEYRGIVKVKVGPITAQYRGAATFQEQDEANHRAVLRAEGRETRGQGNASATITATLTPEGEGTAVRVVTDLTITGRVAQFGRGVLADVSAKLLGQFVDCLESTVLAGDAGAGGTGGVEAGAGAAAPAAEVATAAGASEPSGNGRGGPAAAEAAAATEIPSGVATATAPASDPTGGAMPESAPATAAAPATPGVRRVEHAEARPVDLVQTAGAPVAKRLLPALCVLAVIVLLWRWRRRA